MSSLKSTKSAQTPDNELSQGALGITVDCEDRWQVYHRLQTLDVACQCSSFQPLKVTIQTATEALQLWSIVRRVSQPRTDLAAALTKSWQLPCQDINDPQ